MKQPTPDPSRQLRWEPYLLQQGLESQSFWSGYLGDRERNLLAIVGAGFDPRTCAGLEHILGAGGNGRRDCLLVEYDEGQDSPSAEQVEETRKNEARVRTLIKTSGGEVKERRVHMWTGGGLDRRRNTSRSSASVIGTYHDISEYDVVLIDVSAMPRAVYFPLIAKALHLMDNAFDPARPQLGPRLYVFVSEEPDLDRRINELSIDEDAQYIPGFGAAVDAEATSGIPKIWMPLLGEGHSGQLSRIWELVAPSEICPVLPSPSRDPRRADNIIGEYRELLFDRWRVEFRNIIYGSEQNPFDVYRQLMRSVLQYARSLSTLGGCKAIFSAHSSKLTSLGALMAAYELREMHQVVGLAHVEPKGYDFNPATEPSAKPEPKPVTLRLN